jgi:hypothetical protein
MKAADRTIKSISFSHADPYEVKLLEHSDRFRNFSRYVKRLIQRDMEGGYPAARFPRKGEDV